MLNNKFNQPLSPYLNRPLRSLNEVLNSRLEAQGANPEKATVSCTPNDHQNTAKAASESAV